MLHYEFPWDFLFALFRLQQMTIDSLMHVLCWSLGSTKRQSEGNGQAKLEKESLQAELQQAKTQLAGIMFILLPFLAHAYLSNATRWSKDGAVKHTLSCSVCWVEYQLQFVLTPWLCLIVMLDCDVNDQFAEVLLCCCSSSWYYSKCCQWLCLWQHLE